MQQYSDRLRSRGKTLVCVPTMGFLHEGHLSLIQKGLECGDDVIVSIFVNPTQFGPGEDFEAYPRNFERDCKLCEDAGASVIFSPNVPELYGKNYQTYVTLDHLPAHLCGISRPIHFRGVATVVTKLFNIIKPHIAIFGEKDYQQVQVIRQMVSDLNFDIEIIGAPIVREPDGLAMSSRNTYLKPEHRASALSLYKSLLHAKERVANGVNDAGQIIDATSERIRSFPETAIDYIAICDLETLDDVAVIDQPVLMALAVKVGKPRLIDNMILYPKP